MTNSSDNDKTKTQHQLFDDQPVEQPADTSKSAAPADESPRFSPLPPLPDEDQIAIAQYAERAYLAYAVSVVKGRALPDVCDGQKPVQRRILYAMRQMGLRADARHVKSARVVGDVLGKYHPHGDSSAYDAMVRLAQAFTVRYPLVDGQGNFGTRDGDNAAAMRYTEARLTPLADLVLAELDMGTVDYVPNYDGAFQEPALLPARLPMVLLNGASGIAVGMATDMPSHNLAEVAEAAGQLVQSPGMSDHDLLNYIQGPDFPGGGQIISATQTIRQCYLSGRGSLKMRARWQIEELSRGQWQLVIHELPHGVSSRKVLEEIEQLSNPRVKTGKKNLTQDQTQHKQLLLSVLDSVADESDKAQPVRLVMQPRSSRVSVDELMQVLLTYTSLECSISINLTMIGLDGRPQQKSLPQILREWVQFRVTTVRRRVEYRLNQVEDRLHILAGRMVVYLNLDEVIAVIRESDEPKPALMTRFELSSRQAEDILEIRLRQLARLEGIKIEKEIKALEKERRQLNRLLSKESALRAQIADEIAQDVARFGDSRRTLIHPAQQSTLEVPVVNDPVTVVVSHKHWVRCRQGHGLDLTSTSFKAGDGLLASFECRTTDYCFVVCSNGRVCSIPVNQLPSGRGDGAPLASLIELQEGARIEQVFCGAPSQFVVLATSAGSGFYCQLSDMVARTRSGKQFLNIPDQAAAVPPFVFDQVTENSMVAAISASGRLLLFPLSEFKRLSAGGKGVILMGLGEKDSLRLVAVIDAPGLQVAGQIGKRDSVFKLTQGNYPNFVGKRARGGRQMYTRFKPKSIILSTEPKKDNNGN